MNKTETCIYCGERRRANGSLLCDGCYRTWFKRLEGIENELKHEQQRRRRMMERYWPERVRR